ncbi:MAG: hypothetical protein AB7I59_18160 [Geminicoccaceae bacterium]|uniref:hypothetical protein n=1 Tax=Reyranella sp. TaxID=1929291 RepID=UPI003D11F58A
MAAQAKVKVIAKFHREVPIGEDRERQERFTIGQTPTVPLDVAQQWEAAGLVEIMEAIDADPEPEPEPAPTP